MDAGVVLRGVGRRCAEIRCARGMTQEGLADLLGAQVRYIQEVESGRQNVELRTLVAIATALGCVSMGELFTEPASRETKPGRPRRRTT